MTDITWGAEIAVDHKRPDWLKDEDIRVWSYWGAWSRASDGKPGYPIQRLEKSDWQRTTAIKLPADHPYYKATEAGYKYWPGGDKAPGDWIGDTVLLRNGNRHPAHCIARWDTMGVEFDIIGYKARPMSVSGTIPTDPSRWTVPVGNLFQPGGTLNTSEYHIPVDRLIAAVQTGDLATAQALVLDPVVLRAREICRKHALSPVEPNSAFENAVVEALREPNRPPEEKLRAIVRNVVYTARVEGGHFAGWTTADILSGKYDNTDLFKQMMKAAYNAI